MRRLHWGLVPLAIALGLGLVVGDANRQQPDGVPPRGSGPVQVTNIRVVDGASIDAYVDGKRTAIGLIGVDAPMGNTDCGKQATGMLWGLTKGGLQLEDDPDQTIDERGRRMYRAKKGDGSFIDAALIQAGVARASGKGLRRADLAAAEAEARGAQRGCAWGGPPLAPGGQSGQNGQDTPSPQQPEASAFTLLGNLGLDTLMRTSVAQAAPLAVAYPAGFTQDVVLDTGNGTAPTNFVFAPDGRIFVALQNGIVRVFKNGGLLPTPLIDLQDRVNDHWDHGLLGMALDPNFAQNGHIYLLYTYENDATDYNGKKTGRVARYTVTGDTAAKASELVILGTQFKPDGCETLLMADCIPSEYLSHSVGNLKFATDGSLFLTTGDAASFNEVDDRALRAQNKNSLGGKILRIDTQGKGLADNPFWTGDQNANQSKVWAYGLRNPYRFNLKPSTRIPYLGDVGWNNVEEVSAAPAGANLGWPCYEGNTQQSGYVGKPVCQNLYAQGANAVQEPIFDWSHNFLGTCCGAAATGGVFMAGTAYPAQYQGAYFYADFAKEFIRFLRTDANDVLVPGSETAFATDTDGPVDIELGPDGNIYYMAINTHQLRRIRYIGGGNRPPQAQASATPLEGSAPLNVQFSSSGTLDTDADPLTYNWAFGDGQTSTQPHPAHTYTTTGVKNVILTVSDGRGGTDTADVQVSVGNHRPVATIISPLPSFQYKVGDTITYTGSATDADGDAVTLSWRVLMQHCPGGACHQHVGQSSTGPSGEFTVPDHGDENFLQLELTATDADNPDLFDTKVVSVQPQAVQVTLASTPDGRLLNYDGAQGTTPFTKTTVPGSKHTIGAPEQTGFRFDSWSDSGAQAHDVIVNNNVTYTASFTAIPTVTFDDKTGQDQPLNGQYPTNVINWGTGVWYHSGPWGPFTTKSLSFLGATQTTGAFTFVTPRKLVSIRAYNGGGGSNTITLACAGQPNKQQIMGAGQVITIQTGWTGTCSTVTITSPNGWNTNFDDLVHDSGSPPPPDTTPPTISAVNAGSITSTGATITWTTNEASDSQVEYGPTTGYGSSTTLNTALVTNHSQALSGLTPSTLYHYRVKSRDAAGVLATSPDATFTTTAAPPSDTTPPTISAVNAGSITSTGATITWTTNEASDTQVEYGPTTGYGSSTTLNTALVTSHSAAVSGLTANTLYHYRVKSKDAAGNLATSADLTFTTAAAPPATQTITFDDKSGENQPLTGQYPTGVVDWGSDGWYHSGPWGPFTTKSASFGGPGQTSATLTFVSAKRLVSVRVYNGGGGATTVSLSCAGQTKTQSVAAGQTATISTGWTGACTSVSVGSSNGWDTNFDDFVIAN